VIQLSQCLSTGIPQNLRIPQASSKCSAKFEILFRKVNLKLCHSNDAINGWYIAPNSATLQLKMVKVKKLQIKRAILSLFEELWWQRGSAKCNELSLSKWFRIEKKVEKQVSCAFRSYNFCST